MAKRSNLLDSNLQGSNCKYTSTIIDTFCGGPTNDLIMDVHPNKNPGHTTSTGFKDFICMTPAYVAISKT